MSTLTITADLSGREPPAHAAGEATPMLLPASISPVEAAKEKTMENYQKMYSTLFNAITDALAQIENQNYGDAKSTLIAAQQKAEEMYITAQD